MDKKDKAITGRTFCGRIKDAVRAFQGKPKHTLQLGLRVVRCDECERGECETCCYKHKFEEWTALPNCNDCLYSSRNDCQVCPRPGECVRINCPMWVPKEATQ